MADTAPFIQPSTEEKAVAAGGELPKKIASGGSGGSEKPPKRKSKGGSTITTIYGRRTMKAYPVTESELRHLFGIGLLTALLFSFATGLLTFGFEITKDIDFNQAPKDIVEYWRNIQVWCWLGSIGCGLLSVFFLWRGNHNIGEIKKNSEFDGE